MVVQIHTGEFYYISSSGSVMNTPAAHWVGWLNSLLRSCVPLFVMISGVFLFPVKNEGAFFRKRFSRVLVPFVVWCVVYAFYLYWQGMTTLQGALLDILKIPVNFGTDVGHLWFVYMLLGIYLIAPRVVAVGRIREPQKHGTLSRPVGCQPFHSLHSSCLPTDLG